jgi:hypothetical protein
LRAVGWGVKGPVQTVASWATFCKCWSQRQLPLLSSQKRTVAKLSRYKQRANWLTNTCSTGHKLDMAFREPMAHQTARTAYSDSDDVTQRTVQVTAVTAMDTTVNRGKRKRRNSSCSRTPGGHTHRTAHTIWMNCAVESTFWCVTSFRRVNSYRHFAGVHLYCTRNVGNCLSSRTGLRSILAQCKTHFEPYQRAILH